MAPRRLTGQEEVLWFRGRRSYFRDFDTEVIYKLLEAAERLAKRVIDKGS